MPSTPENHYRSALPEEEYEPDGTRAPAKNSSRRCKAKAIVRDTYGDPLLDANGKRQYRRCRRWAIRGGFVCPTHGGSTNKTKEYARARLAAMSQNGVDAGLERVLELLSYDEDPIILLKALETMLKAAKQYEESEDDKAPIIQLFNKLRESRDKEE